MWVSSNDVEDVVDWFYRRSSSQFLGVFVAGDRKFDPLLQAVIANRKTIDVILGRSIDLVLFSSMEFDAGQNTPIRHISKVTKWTPQLTRNISDATSMSTHDIASSLRLSIDDLPGLIMLKKRAKRSDPESQRLVLSLRGATDVDFLIDFLRAFRKSLERIETARLAGFKFSEASLVELEHNITSRIQETTVIEKREKRIAQYNEEAKATTVPPDNASKQASEAMEGLNKAKIAKHNAELRIAKLDAQIPFEPAVKCLGLADEEITELQTVLNRFERKLSYDLARDRFFGFLGLSEKMLGPIKRIVKLAVAIKTGGAALL